MVHPLCRWVRRLFAAAHRVRRPRPTFRPTLETLEARVTPSVTFAGQHSFAVGPEPQSVAVGDFNGDGLPDLAIANFNSGTVSVLMNTTTAGATAPSFAPQVTFVVGVFSNAYSVAVGDFNGDGRPDLVVTDYLNHSVSVLLNTTAVGATVPSFAPQVFFGVGVNPSSVAVADVNGDGRPDLIVTNRNDDTVSVLMNTAAAGATAPSFATQVTFAVGTEPQSVAVGDFNGDGRPDIAVANVGGTTVSVLLNTTAAGATAPSFAPQQIFTAGASPYSVAVGDFNGDGKPDLAVVSDTGSASVLLNTTATGATTASFAPQHTFAVGANPFSVVVGDFNGDGKPDLAVASEGDNAVTVLLDTTAAGATAPSFAGPQTFTVGGAPKSVAVGDFNGDGRPDLAVANYSDGTVSVLLNTTTPFATAVPVVVADVHGMGVVEFNRTTGQWVQLNPGNPADVTLLAADAAGDVFADYAGYGVFRYTPSVGSWKMVNGTDAVAMAVDPRGDVFLSYNGAGVAVFRLDGSSQLLTPVTASILAADPNGDLAGEFRGYGVMRYTPSTGVWTPLNGTDAVALTIDARGDVFASFNGAGIGEFRLDGSSQPLTPSTASMLAVDANGDLAGEFVGYGVMRYTPSNGAWTPLNGTDAAALAEDAAGDVFASFPGAGVGEFPLSGGGSTVNASAALLLAADPFGDPFAAL